MLIPKGKIDKIFRKNEIVPFVFWNLRTPEILIKQLEQARWDLSAILPLWQYYFVVAVAYAYLDAYEKDKKSSDEILPFVRKMKYTWRLALMKEISKEITLRGLSQDDFAATFKEYECPVVLRTYAARVARVQGQTAWVELWDPDDKAERLARPFRLESLEPDNLAELDRRFELVVYELPNGDVTSHIEPMEIPPGNPFKRARSKTNGTT